jgi:high affinity Mn2+ porin
MSRGQANVGKRVAFIPASICILLQCDGTAAPADFSALAQPPAAPAPADIIPTKAQKASSAYDWSGFYLGGHIGYDWGKSNWSASTAGGPVASGSFGLTQPINIFTESGSWFEGLQAGYNYMLPNRVLIGAEADITGTSFPDPVTGFSTGGQSVLQNGNEVYSENAFYSGTVRGRIGFAPGNWLFYVTGGFAWTYDQLTVTQLASGVTESPFLWRFGWAAGAGVEIPLLPHWSGRLEYLYTGYGNASVSFPLAGQRFTSNLSEQEVRLGLNYQFGDDAAKNPVPALLNSDDVSLHGQATGVWQGFPPIRQNISGLNSLEPKGGQVRETTDATLYLGFRLWQGAELWANPEIDQGFGPGNTLGLAGYSSGEAFKLGENTPYARVQRFFVRQTIDLGGATEKVEADQNVFEGSQTANRLVLTVGRFFVPDLFDTNKYANNPKNDFLNWSVITTGSFDFAGDAWGSTYGAAAEWYQGPYTLRGGVFDLTKTPAGDEQPDGGSGNDPTFKQLEWVVEAEERHELWGQPGKLKLLGYLIDGRMGSYSDFIAYILSHPDVDPGPAMQNVYHWNTRPGASLNLEQQVIEGLGVFARAGWGDGRVEVYDYTDIDETVSGGLSLSGNSWGRPDDTVGLAGAINSISKEHQEFLDLGGIGLQIGDGSLPHFGTERILEAYYNYKLPFYSARLSFDYQLVVNPAYNRDNGPYSLFATRLHFEF